MAINLLTVDGVVMPNPSEYNPTYKDLDSDSSYTSETGVLNRSMIRANHHTISVAWNSKPLQTISTILQAISGKQSIQLRYFDYYDLTFKTGTFYASDRGSTTLKCRSASDGRVSLSFDLIEF